MDLKKYIAAVEDFPKEGILFRDITPLLASGEAFQFVCQKMVDFAKEQQATKIVGPESRGFIFGCPVATALKIGFVPVRKPSKLPRETISETYDLEYGTNELSMHVDGIQPGDRVVIVDDLLATGGTLQATINLVKRLGGEVVGIACLIELLELEGRNHFEGKNILSLIQY